MKKPNDPLYKKRIEAYQKQIEGYKELLGDYNKEQEDNTKYEIITTQRDEEKDNNQLKAKKLETELANLKTTLAQYEKNGGASPEDIAKLRAVIKRKEGDLNKILGKNDISENLNDDNSVLKIEDKQFKLNKEINDLQEKYKQYQENGQLSPEELDKIKKAIHDKAEELKGIKQLESGDDENKNQYLYKEKEIDSDMYLRNFQEEINALKSDMIDKFYGNSEKEKLYNSAMKRLKEHEVKENINGKEYIVKVDEYPEKESDMKFLQLELYEEKLQRLAKNALNPKAKVYSSDEEKAADEQYVKTRNFAYDRKKATTENLTTLGKYGEKYPYLSLQSDKDRGVVANNLIKAAKVATNGLILSRNAVATISRAIGKPISKVYKTIAPDKAAIYANKPTHRYEERKTYFMQEENKRLAEEGKSLRPFRTLMKSRIKAIVNYKEGNAAILESGYEDIKRSYIDKAKVQYYKSKLNDMDTYAEYLLNESRDLLKGRDPLLVNTSEMEKYEAIQEALEDLNNKKQQIIKNPKLNGIIDKNGHVKNKAIVQTDAISLKSHDKANKANVTRATTIAKAATIAGVKFTGPKIKDWMLQHCTTQKAQIVPGKTVKQWVPDLNEPSKVTNPADISKAMTNEEDLLEKLSIKNIMQNSQNGHASFAYGNSGKNITEDGLSYFRGAAQEINGNVVSISDANGFDITGVTSGTIDPSLLNNGNVSENVNIFDILANLQRKAGNDVTSKDLLNKVLSCKNTEEQTKVIEEMTKGLELWKSNSSQGMPVGWDDASDEISGALKGLQETIKQAVSESQATTRAFNYGEISGHFKDITTSDTINYVTTVNPRIVKALGIQGKIANGMSVVDAVRMTFENLRKTKSEKPQNKVPKTPREKLGFTGSSKKADQIVFAQKAQADSVKETIRREIEDEGR